MTQSEEMTLDAAQALLSRVSQRDESALRELHDRFSRRIFQFARARLRDDHTAETVMIDTLYEVWNKPDAFRGESRFSTWLLGIAKYKVLTELRKMNKPVDDDVDDHADSLADPNANVAGDYEAAEDGRILRRCMELLVELQRETVQLVYIEGMSMVDIAKLQEIPEGTVRTRLHHARKNLKTCVQRKTAL